MEQERNKDEIQQQQPQNQAISIDINEQLPQGEQAIVLDQNDIKKDKNQNQKNEPDKKISLESFEKLSKEDKEKILQQKQQKDGEKEDEKDQQTKYQVDKILDREMREGKEWYKVKWVGYTDNS